MNPERIDHTPPPPPPPFPCHVEGQFPVAPPGSSHSLGPAPGHHRPHPPVELNAGQPAPPQRPFDVPQPKLDPPPLAALATTAAARRKRRTGMITLVILVGGLVVLVVLGVSEARSSAINAEVGDCLSDGTDASDITTVDCSAPEAGYTVVGKLEGRSETDARLSACAEFADATQSYWEGERGVTTVGTVLCMKAITK